MSHETHLLMHRLWEGLGYHVIHALGSPGEGDEELKLLKYREAN